MVARSMDVLRKALVPGLAAVALAVGGCGDSGETGKDTAAIRNVVNQFALANDARACDLLTDDALRNVYGGFTQDLRRQQQLDSPLGADTTYAATLTPENIDAYRAEGFCTIVTMSLIRGRAQNAAVPQALAYYQRLQRDSRLLYTVSPFKPGRKPVPLHFDFSYDYYPTAYHRPGAIVDVYRLNSCSEKTGRVPAKPFGDTGLQKGVGTSYLPAP